MPGWFRCFEERPAASARLICLPHAGGSAAFFWPWARAAAAELELHAVQYPGRADRLGEPMVGDVGELVRRIAGVAAPLLDRPFALFGHSMGATLAYELTRRLEARGTPPLHLFASGSLAPHDPYRRVPIAHKDDDALVAALGRLGGIQPEMLATAETREFILPYVRNDLRLIESYRHVDRPPVGVPITALIGDADPIVRHGDPGRWAELTRGPFTLRTFAGDHFYLAARHGEILAEIGRHLAVSR